MPYTGNLAISARYPAVDLSADIEPAHAAGRAPDAADMWGGQNPAAPGPDYGRPGLWVGGDDTSAPQAPWRPDPTGHTAECPPRLDPPRAGWVEAQQVAAREMMRTHSADDAELYLSLPQERQFAFLGQTNTVTRQEGQRSWEPGLTGPLARGRNSYAQNNPATAVYGGEGMRYGYDTITYGYYRTPLPMMMRYRLRALATQSVQFPVDTPPVDNPSMRASFSSGIQIARPVLNAVPRLYAPPSSTSISDATMAAAPVEASDVFASDTDGTG
jgi:hypothetical protein